jgi:hypothetical protein
MHGDVGVIGVKDDQRWCPATPEQGLYRRQVDLEEMSSGGVLSLWYKILQLRL